MRRCAHALTPIDKRERERVDGPFQTKGLRECEVEDSFMYRLRKGSEEGDGTTTPLLIMTREEKGEILIKGDDEESLSRDGDSMRGYQSIIMS